MFRFSLLEHDWPTPHFDLMLEWGSSLLTWRLPTGDWSFPSRAEQLLPHRLIYLDYEGPVSNNRGSVKRIDSGEIRWLVMTEVQYVFEAKGQRLNGRYCLNKTNVEWLFARG